MCTDHSDTAPPAGDLASSTVPSVEADVAIVRRADARDEAAWRTIFHMAQDLVYGAAWRYGLDELRDDLLQDVMERLLRQIGTYRGESPLRVWVASVCYNRLRNAYRAQRVRDRFAGPSPSADGSTVASAGATDAAAETATDAAAILSSERALAEAAMAGLAEPHWNVVLLRVVAELSVEETARRLAVREGTVKSRLSRALAELRLYVLVLRGATVSAAATASGMSVPRARAKLGALLPLWRRMLPAPLASMVEWRLAPQLGPGTDPGPAVP